MIEIIISGVTGFILGAAFSLAFFLCGMKYATKLIYKIKEDIPLEQIGTPTEQESAE